MRVGTPAGPRRIAVAGAAAVAGYLAAAALSGHLSVLARRPLLEGNSAPPPYNFVTPPASVASTNKPPYSLTKTIGLGPPERGAGVFGTGDFQAQLVLDPASFPASAGTGTVTLTIEPLDPAKLGATPPAAYTIEGNAYRLRIATKTGGEAPPFAIPAHLVLTYPTDSLFFKNPFATHTVVRLEGSAWTTIPTADSPVAQQAAADVTTLGTFAVAGKPLPGSSSSSVGLIVGIAVGAVVVVVALLVLIRSRSRRRRGQRRSAGPRS